MTRNFVVLTDINNKEHTVNAVDILEICDVKNCGNWTIILSGSRQIEIDSNYYAKLKTVLKPTIVEKIELNQEQI